jgi:putative PIN family toxin of toxin-antitoxin system
MTRAVLDTNVLISSIFWRGKPNTVVRRGINQDYDMVLSAPVLDELTGKLENKFDVPQEKTATLATLLLSHADIVDVTTDLAVVEDDPDDDKIIECAVDGNVAYIVSGDEHLKDLEQYNGIDILSPTDFLNELD